MSMEIKTVGIIGAGAIGSYFLWGMKELTESRICMIASGERKKRLEKQGLIINEETIHYPVKTPSEAHGVDLLLIATKYGALRDILDDVKTIVDGIKMVKGSLVQMLENKYGLASYAVEGDEFDPDIHEAIGRVEEEGIEKETLKQIYLKGYKLKDKVIRNAKVMVSVPKN